MVRGILCWDSRLVSAQEESTEVEAVRCWDVRPDEEILKALSISERTFRSWTKDKKRQQYEELQREIYRLWMRCETQDVIAEAVGEPQQTIADQIVKFTENGNSADSGIFHNFDPKIYSVWNFPEATKDAFADQAATGLL